MKLLAALLALAVLAGLWLLVRPTVELGPETPGALPPMAAPSPGAAQTAVASPSAPAPAPSAAAQTQTAAAPSVATPRAPAPVPRPSLTPEQAARTELAAALAQHASTEQLASWFAELPIHDEHGSTLEVDASTRRELALGFGEMLQQGLARTAPASPERLDRARLALEGIERGLQDGGLRIGWRASESGSSPDAGDAPFESDAQTVRVRWQRGRHELRVEVQRDRIDEEIWFAWRDWDQQRRGR